MANGEYYGQTRPGLGVWYLRPTEETQLYGQPEYRKALSDWQRMYGTYSQMMGQVTPALKEMMDYYKPGGGFGAGQRTEAERTVKGGVAKDLTSMIASGMSSRAGAGGLQRGAAADLVKMYQDIEDRRAALWGQAVTPYTQVMSQMANIQAARPTYAQYVKPVTQTSYRWF